MREEFDTLHVPQISGLNGWFDGFCPSNGIADDLERKGKGVWAQKTAWDKKLEALKNGRQAIEWESLKKEIRRLDAAIKAEKEKVNQEQQIANELGVGLGAWCRGAVSRRKKAQESLRNAEKSLGEVKGAFNTLTMQQNQGIIEAGKVIKQRQEEINLLREKLIEVKQKIAVYKATRDNKPQENTNAADAEGANKKALIGTLKDNALLIAGGIAAVSAFVYIYKTSKGKQQNVKAVQV